MGGYRISGTCYVSVDWGDDAETYIEVVHEDEGISGEEYDIPVLQSGDTQIEVDIEDMYIEADNPWEAEEMAKDALENTQNWSVTIGIGGETDLVSTDITDVTCELEVEEED